MSYPRKLYIQWNILFADVVLFSGIFHFYLLQHDGRIQIDYLPWLLALTMALVINTILRAKSAPINLVIVLNVLMSAGVGIWGQQLLSLDQASFMPRAFFFIVLTASTAHSAMLVQDEPKQSQMILYLDIQVIAVAGLMALRHIGTLSNVDSLVTFCQISCFSTLLALILFRLQLPHKEKTTGRQVSGAILLCVFFLMVLLLAIFASTHSQSASEFLIHLVLRIKDLLISVLIFGAHLVERVMLWLLNLFPDQESDMLLPEPESGLNMEELAAETAGDSGIFILIFIGIIITGALIYLLYRLRGHRWKSEAKAAPPKGTAKRRSNWKNGFSALWKMFLSRIRFEIAYIRNRKTASGLLVWTERKLFRKGYKRGKDESPSAYLRRLTAMADPKEASAALSEVSSVSDKISPNEAGAIFLELADILEQQYYRKTASTLPDGFYKNYRRMVKQFAHI